MSLIYSYLELQEQKQPISDFAHGCLSTKQKRSIFVYIEKNVLLGTICSILVIFALRIGQNQPATQFLGKKLHFLKKNIQSRELLRNGMD